jgi:hypothetical protein
MLHPELYLMLHHADARGLHDAAARDRLKVHLRRHWKQQLPSMVGLSAAVDIETKPYGMKRA